MTLRCYPRSNSASNVVYFTERFDPAEMAVIEAVVSCGDDVVDAGANIGVYSLLLAKLVGPTGSVVSIEPGRVAIERLRENISINRLENVEVHPVALGSARGRAKMTMGSDVSNTLTAGPGTYAVEEVEVVTIDELAPAAPSFIKLDVEGFEHEVLKGASRTLDARPIWQIELTEHLLTRAGTSARAVCEELENAGYRVGYPILAHGAVEFRDSGSANAIAVPVEKWDWLARRLAR